MRGTRGTQTWKVPSSPPLRGGEEAVKSSTKDAAVELSADVPPADLHAVLDRMAGISVKFRVTVPGGVGDGWVTLSADPNARQGARDKVALRYRDYNTVPVHTDRRHDAEARTTSLSLVKHDLRAFLLHPHVRGIGADNVDAWVEILTLQVLTLKELAEAVRELVPELDDGEGEDA